MGSIRSSVREAAPLVITAGFLIVTLPGAMGRPKVTLALVCVLVMVTAVSYAGLRRVGQATIIMAMLFAPLDSIRPVPGFPLMTTADFLWVVGFTLLAPSLLTRPLSVPSGFGFGVFGVLVVGAVASVGAAAPGTSFEFMLRLLLGAFGLPVLFCWWRPTERVVTWMARAYLIGAALNTIGALTVARVDGPRAFGWASHPNIMGLCAVLAISLAPYLWASERQWRAAVIVCSGLCIYGIWISGSRGALLALVFLALAYPAMTKSIWAALGVVTGGVGTMLLVGWLVENSSDDSPLTRLLGNESTQESDRIRAESARIAWQKFLDEPIIGRGFEPTDVGAGLGTHNIYLQAAVAIGLIGLIFFLIALVSSLLPAFRARRPQGLLGLPGLTYAFVGPVIPLLWDRYIWSLLALGLLAPSLVRAGQPESVNEPELRDRITSESNAGPVKKRGTT